MRIDNRMQQVGSLISDTRSGLGIDSRLERDVAGVVDATYWSADFAEAHAPTPLPKHGARRSTITTAT